MKTAVLTCCLIVCSAAAFAQTPAAAPQAASQTITLTGCVGGGSNAQPITLANAMVVPGGDLNAASPSPVPGAVSSPATQPPGAAGTAGPVGTSGTAATTGTAGAPGTDRKRARLNSS